MALSTDWESVEAARSAVASLKPAVVITGGSRGIGLALAKRFAITGRSVAIVARNAAELATAAAKIESGGATKVVTISCDVAGADAYDRIRDALAASGLYLDTLVNCAGMGLAGPFAEQNDEELSELVATNIKGLTLLTRRALAGMLPRRQGGIMNFASLGAYVPGPNQAAYYASKAYVQSLTEALASEASGTGIMISVVVPGPVDTGFHADMGAERSLYRFLLPSLSAERTAKIAYRNFMAGHRVIVPGILNRLLFLALRVLPHPVSVPITGLLLGKPTP